MSPLRRIHRLVVETPRIVRDATRMEMPADLEASLLAALRRAMHRHDG